MKVNTAMMNYAELTDEELQEITGGGIQDWWNTKYVLPPSLWHVWDVLHN